MNTRKPGDDSTRRDTPGAGRTERAREEGGRDPRLPHERDESADSQASRGPTAGVPDAADIGEQAFEDLRSGQQDTGRAPVTDAVYERLQKREEPKTKRS